MSRLTKGTLVRLSRKGKDCAELRCVPRDSIGLVMGRRPCNVRGTTYRIKWFGAYYSEYSCYRHEVKFADSDQMKMNKERIRREIYATKYKSTSK